MKTYLLFLAAFTLCAQPPVAPTTGEQVGNPRGDNAGEYNVMDSFELGYRFAAPGGDFNMYRSTVNYTDGVRLLSSSLSVQSKDGHGRWFDHLQLNTQGLGNDPYQSVSLRVEKNKLYRYDMIWRENNFFDPSLTIANGAHFENTSRRWQDHDLTLFPQGNFKFFLGYSRNVEDGPALTTIQLFDFRGDEFPLIANIHRLQNEYRLGGEVKWMGFRLNVLRGWEDFKEDTPTNILASSEPGLSLLAPASLTNYQATQPYHGTSPYWRVGLFRDGSKFWAVNGRFSYVAGERNFIDNEFSAGITPIGAAMTQQILAIGDARRPALTANLTVSFFPTSFLTVTNQTSFANIRTQGDALFAEIQNGIAITPFIPYTYLGIRTVANSTDAEIRVRKWFSMHAGYTYSNRLIGVIDGQENLGGPVPAVTPIMQTNQLHAGTLGLRLRPIQGLTIMVNGEIGRADMPYTPISDKNYQTFHAHAVYKRKTFHVGAYAKTDYNLNSVSLTSYASRSRNYGADGSWTPNNWFAIDAGYNKIHLNTLGGLDFFDNGQLTNFNSLYISNIHTATLGARVSIKQRADVYFGYSHTQDVGDGRSTPDGLPPGTATTNVDAFLVAQTFPLKFLSPEARFSLQLNRRMRWNLGYQYYGYAEQFSSLQNFHAHTGYSSILFSF